MRDHEEFESPVDLPADEPGRHGLGWTTVTIAVASVFLLATNAFSLRGWIDEQSPGPLQARLADAATAWEDATASIGLGAPRAAVHRAWKAAQAARIKGEEPATSD
jgi:hypothetical protein